MAHSSFGTGWPNCQPGNMVMLRRSDGFARAFHKDIVDLIAICVDVTESLGYNVRPEASWGYSCRAVAGTNSPSNHSWGTAIDINADTNPRRADHKFQSDIPRRVVDFWKSTGFRWGGDWNWPDPMHFDWPGTAAQARQKAADLRAFFGGSVGYVIPPTIKQGSVGKTVKKAQGLLVAHGGVQVEIDGTFDQEMHNVTVYFQGANGLVKDGVIGNNTWRALIER
jgi:peptidoglycan hydrolase-like protein with peptidoglycan-binding domain